MKKIIMLITVSAAVLIPAINIQAQQQAGNRNQDTEIRSVIEKTEKQLLSVKEEEGLLFLYEEEKLARDFYSALYDKWGKNIFRNISKSEQTHMDAIKDILDRYDVEIPESSADNRFKNRGLESLYKSLLDEGMKSYEKALKNALLVEEKDIKDLLDEIRLSDNNDIRLTYQNLMKGSRNHLRSFSRQLSREGGNYIPEFLSSNEFSRIRNSEMERGGVIMDPDFVF